MTCFRGCCRSCFGARIDLTACSRVGHWLGEFWHVPADLPDLMQLKSFDLRRACRDCCIDEALIAFRERVQPLIDEICRENDGRPIMQLPGRPAKSKDSPSGK